LSSGYQSRPGRIIHDMTLGSGFVGSAMANLLGSDFSLAGERICGGSLNHLLFRGVADEVRILVVAPPSISIFWIQTSIGVWPSLKSVAWRGLGF
jgi:hypothetical protein